MTTIFRQYAENATIHGLRDISRSWNKISLRGFYIACQLISVSAMCYHMGIVILGYTWQPTSVITTTVTSRTYEYPTMTFCPNYWLNATKFQQSGLSRQALLYGLSLLRGIRIFENIDSVTEAESEFNEYVSRNFSTYFEFYLDMANDFDNGSLFCQGCARWPPHKIVTEHGVCYFMRFRDYTSNVLATRLPRLIYNPIKFDESNNSILNSFRTTDITETLYVGMHSTDFFSLEPIFLLLNNTYVLRITPMRHIFIDDSNSPCVDRREKVSKLMCQSYCHESTLAQKCSVPRMLGFFNGSRRAGPNNEQKYELWSSLLEDSQNYDGAVQKCDEEFSDTSDDCDEILCPPACHKLTYSTTVSAVQSRRIFEDLPEASLTLVISYQVRPGIIEAKEVMSYTWYSFLSNVGGVMGLWCGASLISMFQLITFFGKELVYFCNQWKLRNKSLQYNVKNETNGTVTQEKKYCNGLSKINLPPECNANRYI